MGKYVTIKATESSDDEDGFLIYLYLYGEKTLFCLLEYDGGGILVPHFQVDSIQNQWSFVDYDNNQNIGNPPTKQNSGNFALKFWFDIIGEVQFGIASFKR